ncbi:uncharacterized protein [Apteryx mantelli]|uniref:Fibrous sheath-interacting protein 2 C-terminal domain-containing protein n=1 Tax=Apteryx mantelli TaxID=2696672 RepID=A0ABM4F4Z4_9AVES
MHTVQVGHQELPAATQRSQSPAESHQDGLPLLPCTPSPPASGHSSTKRDGMAERTRGIQSTQGFIFASRETGGGVRCKQAPLAAPRFQQSFQGKFPEMGKLPAENLSGSPHLPYLAPLPAKAATQADESLDALTGKMPGAASETKLPTLETSPGSSPRDRAHAVGAIDDIQQEITQEQQLKLNLNLFAQTAAAKILERVSKGLKQTVKNFKEADPRENFQSVSGAATAPDSGKGWEEEQQKPFHLPLISPQLPKQDACAQAKEIDEPVHSMPVVRPRSSGSGQGKPRTRQNHGTKTTHPSSWQLSSHSCFPLGAESIASGEIQGGPAYKEQDECLPTHPAAPRLPQPPTRVDFANVFRETCHELKSRKLPAPKDTSAREAKAQSLVKAARSCDLVFHSGDLQLPELQAPLTVMPILTTKATPFAEILAEHSSETPEEADTGRTRFAQGILGDPGMAARAECQGPALPATALEDTIQQLVTAAWSHANDASPGPSWQLVQPNADKTMEERRVAVAQGLVAHTNGPVAPASRVLEQTMKPGETTSPTAPQGPDPHAHGSNRAANRASGPALPGRGHGPGHPGQPQAGQGPQGQALTIIPRIGGRPLRIHPDVTSEHLSVLSIKTESAEELNSSCLIRTEQSLAQLRKLHLWRKKSQKEREVKEQEGEGKRFTLTMSGRLNVKPKEVFCRNSFPNLWEPELTRVELLKDVTTKQDLMERLVVHSVKKEQSMRAEQRGLRAPKGVELEVVAEEDDDEEDANEDILKVEDSLLICKRRLHIMMNRQEERRHAWILWGAKEKSLHLHNLGKTQLPKQRHFHTHIFPEDTPPIPQNALHHASTHRSLARGFSLGQRPLAPGCP